MWFSCEGATIGVSNWVWNSPYRERVLDAPCVQPPTSNLKLFQFSTENTERCRQQKNLRQSWCSRFTDVYIRSNPYTTGSITNIPRPVFLPIENSPSRSQEMFTCVTTRSRTRKSWRNKSVNWIRRVSKLGQYIVPGYVLISLASLYRTHNNSIPSQA